MIRWLTTASMAAAIFLAVPSVSRAQAITDLNAPVEKGSSLTFIKLVSKIFKGVRDDRALGNLVTSSDKVFRRIGAKERTVLPAETPLTSFHAIRVRGDGRRYLILMIGAETGATDVPGGGASVVAVFSEGSEEPRDVAEVKTDAFCFFGEAPPLAVGPDDVFTVVNHHFNSNQAYLDTALYRIQGGRLQLIDSIFTLTVGGICEKSFEEILTWRTEQDGGAPYPKIVASVALTRGPGKNESSECLQRGLKPRREKFSETYRWNKAGNHYISGGQGFEALERFNEKNI